MHCCVLFGCAKVKCPDDNTKLEWIKYVQEALRLKEIANSS